MRRHVFFLLVLLASLGMVLATPTRSAPEPPLAAGPSRDFIGPVFLDVTGSMVPASRIELGNELSLPREFRRVTLTYVPPSGTRRLIQGVVWVGAEGLARTREGFPAVLEMASSGDYQVLLQVTLAGDPAHGRRPMLVENEFHLRALDIPAASARAVIDYPGTSIAPPVDLNGDFHVDERDLARFWDSYGSRREGTGYSSLSDWDGSGGVDLDDLLRFVDAYQGWKGREIGPTYGNGLVYPVAGRPFFMVQYSFGVPAALFRAHTEPSGMEPWIEWEVDGRKEWLGPVFAHEFKVRGEHVVRPGLFGAQGEAREERRVTIYTTRIRNFAIGHELIEDGVEYTLEAATDPPGYEDYVNWFAAAKYGTVTQTHGRGRTFTFRFDGTWGPWPAEPEWVFQWLGVQADDVYINQDQKRTFALASQTVCNVPLPRTRVKLGLGELVDISTVPPIDADWSVAGGGTVDPPKGATTRFTAKQDPSVSTVTARDQKSGKTLQIVFTVVAPNGIDNAVSADPGCGTAGPPNNTIGASTTFSQTIKPNDVAFRYASFRENIQVQQITWPNGTQEANYPGVNPVPYITNCANGLTDDSQRCGILIGRLDPPPPGGPLMAFAFDIIIHEEYLNSGGGWTVWLATENHPKEFDANGRCRTSITNTNGTAATGSWQGPWQ